MTVRRNEVPHESPVSIRNEVFGHRMRGLDEDEVRDYLEALADQIEETNERLYERSSELEELRREAEALRAENRRLREATAHAPHAPTDTNPKAVEVLGQAQQVADQLVQEAVIRARDMIVSARHQQRDMLEHPHDSADTAVRRTGARQVQYPPTEYSTPISEVEHVRTVARAAQGELKSLLEALTDQVERLSQMPQLEPGRSQVVQPAMPMAPDRDTPFYEQVWSLQFRAAE